MKQLFLHKQLNLLKRSFKKPVIETFKRYTILQPIIRAKKPEKSNIEEHTCIETSKPINESSKPINETSKPINETSKPIESSKPINESSKPINETSKQSYIDDEEEEEGVPIDLETWDKNSYWDELLGEIKPHSKLEYLDIERDNIHLPPEHYRFYIEL